MSGETSRENTELVDVYRVPRERTATLCRGLRGTREAIEVDGPKTCPIGGFFGPSTWGYAK
jgi:hypothetical protein